VTGDLSAKSSAILASDFQLEAYGAEEKPNRKSGRGELRISRHDGGEKNYEVL